MKLIIQLISFLAILPMLPVMPKIYWNYWNLYQQHYPEPDPEIGDRIDSIDLDFISQDLPKLLASMRVGADRIQEIVRSLRNFSRTDEV
jgi:signal transduction histidine kinase